MNEKEPDKVEEVIKYAHKEFLEMYGDRLPNPEHCPREFEYYVRLYKYVKGL